MVVLARRDGQADETHVVRYDGDALTVRLRGVPISETEHGRVKFGHGRGDLVLFVVSRGDLYVAIDEREWRFTRASGPG